MHASFHRFQFQQTQVPSRVLSDREQKDLIYRRRLQYESGSVAQQKIGDSTATRLMNKKRKFNELVRASQTATQTGALQHMMMAHFREHCNPNAFYSLPKHIIEQVPIQQLDLALLTGLNVKGKNIQPSGLLPLTSPANSMPLQIRDSATEDLSSMSAFFGELQDDGEKLGGNSADSGSSDRHTGQERALAFNTPGISTKMQDLIDASTLEGLVIFRVTDKMPSKKKRPLASADNIQALDFAIRVYQVVEAVRDESGNIAMVWVRQGMHDDVPLIQLFNFKDPKETIAKMCQWEIQAREYPGQPDLFLLQQMRQTFQVRVGAPCSLETVDVDKGLKPSLFELHLLLESEGWSFRKTSNLTATQLRRCPIDLQRKFYFSRGFWHCLTLLNFNKLKEYQSKIFYGQLEAYYEAIFRLAARGQRAGR